MRSSLRRKSMDNLLWLKAPRGEGCRDTRSLRPGARHTGHSPACRDIEADCTQEGKDSTEADEDAGSLRGESRRGAVAGKPHAEAGLRSLDKLRRGQPAEIPHRVQPRSCPTPLNHHGMPTMPWPTGGDPLSRPSPEGFPGPRSDARSTIRLWIPLRDLAAQES